MERLGLLITFGWIVLFLIILYFNQDTAKNLSFNEWGDFLAGVTAPIAFLWLIIGYWLQKNELKNNNETLIKQQEELSKQVNELSKQNEILQESKIDTKDIISAINNISDAIVHTR